VPILGAAGGVAVNLAFMNHYQRTAWGHFTVRRLERAHGEAAVLAAWGPPEAARRPVLRSRR
jgi:hypothetical protein